MGIPPIPEEDKGLTMEDVFGRSEEEEEDMWLRRRRRRRRCRQRSCRRKVKKELSPGNETTATGEQTRKGRAQEDALSLSRLVRHVPKSPWTQSCPSTGDKGGARSSPSGLHGNMSSKDEQDGNTPLVLMVDEETGDKYARMVEKKGLGE